MMTWAKRIAVTPGMAITLSGVYDFWHAYRQTKSVGVGVVAMVFGLALFAIFLRLNSKRQK